VSVFDLEAIRQWADYRAPASTVDERGNVSSSRTKVSVVVPAAIWAQMLSDLAACCDEIEKWQEGAA